jgi:ribonuclease-3
VLGLVVTDEIFRAYPTLAEGELAKIRASVVSAIPLSEIGAALDIGPALTLGRGEESSGGREKPSILANAVEAIIGAVYLDGGMEAARRVVLDLVAERIADAAEGPGGLDFKTRLQELAAKDYVALPEYEVAGVGPDHDKRFFATVRIGDHSFGPGEGRSKKQAEQAAARAAWEALRDA